jgi:5-methylcytosine-specific restriction endonuclease McrA
LQEQQSTRELELKERQMDEEINIKKKELQLKELQVAEELKIKADDFKIREQQALEEMNLKKLQSAEQNRLNELRLKEELKLKEQEAAAAVKLLEQQTKTAMAQTAKAQNEVDAKTARMSKQRDVLADTDKRSALMRAFPVHIAAKCEVVGCTTYISAFSCSIVEEPGYTLGHIDKLLVVCAEHAKQNRARAHAIEHLRRKLETWLYRVGPFSRTLCALCGRCDLSLWNADTHVCHVHAGAQGGSYSLENLVIGSIGCNLQQGIKTLDEYQAQIRVAPIPLKICVPENKIDEAMKVLTSKDKRVRTKCPLARLESMLAEPNKPKQVQRTLNRMMSTRSFQMG